jgi:DNA-binding protein Fis
MQKALIFSRGYPIHPEDVSRAIGGESLAREAGDQRADEIVRQWVRQTLAAGEGKDVFEACMDHFASLLISEALDLTGGNRSRAAKLLGISRPTLLSKIDKYGLKVETSVKFEGS